MTFRQIIKGFRNDEKQKEKRMKKAIAYLKQLHASLDISKEQKNRVAALRQEMEQKVNGLEHQLKKRVLDLELEYIKREIDMLSIIENVKT